MCSAPWGVELVSKQTTGCPRDSVDTNHTTSLLPVAFLTGSCHCPQGHQTERRSSGLRPRGQGPRAKGQAPIFQFNFPSFTPGTTVDYAASSWYFGPVVILPSRGMMLLIVFQYILVWDTFVFLVSLLCLCRHFGPLRSAGRSLYLSSARHVSERWTVTNVYFTLNSEDALHTVLEVKGSGFDVASLSDNFVLGKYTVLHGVRATWLPEEEQATQRHELSGRRCFATATSGLHRSWWTLVYARGGNRVHSVQPCVNSTRFPPFPRYKVAIVATSIEKPRPLGTGDISLGFFPSLVLRVLSRHSYRDAPPFLCPFPDPHDGTWSSEDSDHRDAPRDQVLGPV